MTKIVIGFRHHGKTETEVTVVGDGDRRHVDRVLARVPEAWRSTFTEFVCPLLEGRSAVPGRYLTSPRLDETFIVWWKRVEVLP